ncbi:MAG: sulfopyruvate decarboxylase [Chloroflexi bacterium]|nr:sulfopyruvate decarboxylase [Chloroflexota bacterium]
MKESAAKLLAEEIKAAGIKFVIQVPDTGLRQVYWLARDDPELELIPVTNEAEGAFVAGGMWLAGKRAILVIENSGLRVASEALGQLGIDHFIPVLILTSYRGDIGDGNWWDVDHGVTMQPLLQALRIPYRILNKEEDIGGILQQAIRTMNSSKNHVAIILGGGLMW